MFTRHPPGVLLAIAAVACALSACETSPAPDRTTSPIGWTPAPPLHHARAAHAVVSTTDAIYALAGTGDAQGGPVLEVEQFDGKTWTDVTRLPGEGLNAPAAVALDGRIYLIGGFGTVTNVPTATVRVYDPKTGAWTKAPDLPSPRGGHAAAVMNGKVHVVGGGNSQSTLADHSVFDPAAGRWEERAPLPHSLGSPVLVVLGTKLYAIGGRSGPKDYGEVLVYDAKADSWTSGPPIAPRATCGAIEIAGSIYLFGGESQARSEVLAEVLCLPAGTHAWNAIAPMPTARSFARAVRFQGAVYVVGGSPEPQSNHAPRGTAVVERLGMETR